MNLQIFRVAVFAILANALFFGNCDSSPGKTGFQLHMPELQRQTPIELFAIAQSVEPQLQDSIYQTIVENFRARDKMGQIGPHLDFYKKIRGAAPETQAFILTTEGNLLQYAGKLDSAQIKYSQALNQAKSLRQKMGEAKALHGLGVNLYYKGEYGQSTERLIEAMNAFGKLGDSAQLNTAKLDQCGNLYRMRDIGQMKKLALSSLPWFSKTRDTISLAATFNIFGLAYEQADRDSAILWHKKALELRRAFGDFRGAGESLNNIAVLLVDIGKHAEAANIYGEAIALMEKSGDLRNVGILKINLARCYRSMGNVEQAKSIYHDAIREFRKNGQRDALAVALERLSYLEEKHGSPLDALDTYKKSRLLQDSLFDERKQRDIRELNFKFETALKEQQIARLEAQKRSNQLWLGLVLVSSALLVSSLFFYISRLRQKQKLLANEQKLLEAREQVQAKNLEMTRLELNFNRKKLDETAANLSEKSRLVEELRENLDALRNSLGDQLHQQEVQRSLSNLYGMKILTDDDWNDFRVQFEQVHPGLINQFRKRFPDLSDAELRLILHIKIGVRSREISTMLGISPESVNKTRYRLRRRLGLEETEKLEEFVEKFS